MTCQFCRGRIGAARWLVDNQFCCDDHRRAARSSARVVREKKDIIDYYDEYSTVDQPRAPEPPPPSPPPQAAAPASRDSSTFVFAVLLILGIGLGVISLAPAGRGKESRHDEPLPPNALREFIRAHATVKLQADFQSGMDSWVPPRKSGGEPSLPASTQSWERHNGFLKPAGFRVWEPSMDLTDYHLEFAGSIEKKAMSWTYRTLDARNFYGGRLVITKPGPLPEVQLIRYASVKGEEVRRFAIRLPLTVRADSVYQVDVKLNGPEISTSVNGVIVDAWSDERFSSGGVGFYAQNDEVALLRYIQVTQKDNIFGRILAHFGLVHPTFFRLPR